MNSFAIGDRVKRDVRPLICDADVPVGTPGTVVAPVADFYRVQFDNGGIANCSPNYLAPHVDVFPIPADKDPWRESEPNHLAQWPDGFCRASNSNNHWACSRVEGHAGHHVSRTAGVVNARWPQSSPPAEHQRVAKEVGAEIIAACKGRFGGKQAEKTGLVVGMEVVRTDRNRPKHPKDAAEIGERGHVLDVYSGGFGVSFERHCGGVRQSFQASDFGTKLIPASEWDARQRRDTEPSDREIGWAKALGDLVSLPSLPRLPRFPPLPDLTDISTAVGADLDQLGDLAGVPRYEFTHAFVLKLARALFELDHDAHAIRVGDEGRGGIGKAAVLDRMWDRVSDESRSVYEWRAAIALKRAGELA